MLRSDGSSPSAIEAATGAPESEFKNVALIIFDCDGVLIDSEPIASRTLAQMLREAGIDITDARAHATFTGNSEAMIRDILRRDFVLHDVAGLFSRWHTRLYAEFERSLVAMQGMAEVVVGLHGAKCVASNSSMVRLERSLGRLDLWTMFHPHIFSADVVKRPKPAPDLMLHCATQFGVAPDSCVMIDDSPHGIEAANAAGMVSVGFVDPADPRSDRAGVLRNAGAFAIARGASELMAALEKANQALATSASKMPTEGAKP